MFAILRGLREQGKTIIIITHKLAEVLALSDNITVMRDGEVVGNLPTKEATAEGLARLMVGREVLLRVEKDAAKPRGAVLAVQDLSLEDEKGSSALERYFIRGARRRDARHRRSRRQRPDRVDRNNRGPAQSERRRCAAGRSNRSTISTRTQRKRRGIAHIPEDRHRRGLLLSFDLAGNSILGVHRDPPISGAVLLNTKVIEERAERLVKEYDVRPPNISSARARAVGRQSAEADRRARVRHQASTDSGFAADARR